MSPATACPNELELLQLLHGKTSVSSSEVFAAHLERCERCLSAMERLLAPDTLVEAMRAQATLATTPTPPVQALIQRLIHLDKELAGADDRGRRPVQALIQRLVQTQPVGEERTVHHPAIPVATPVTITDRFDFLAPPQTPDEMGRLGAYRILKVLGSGGMGVVFQAEDDRLKRKVALKVIRPEVADKPGVRQRFLREAQAAAALEHENIVTVYQVDEVGGVPFLAMQCLRGLSLEDRLQHSQPMTPAQVVWLGKQIARGLAAAHEAGLVHRDVKPANLWIEPVQGGRIKILDFGLAHLGSSPDGLTQVGALLGTPAYMAPEQARGEKVSPSSDLFSLGCVLYRLCSGRLPFSGNSTMAVLTALASKEPTPVASLNSDLPPALANLVMELLAKDPAKRPASAREAADRLDAIGRQSATVVSPPQAIPVARIVPPQAIPVAAVPVAAIPLAEVPVAAVPVAAPVATPISPTRGARRKRIGVLVAVALAVLLPLAYFKGGALVRYTTNKGVLLVRVDDANVEVTVKQGGAVVLDHSSKREFVLKAGDGELEVFEKASGLKLATKRFTLTRGGRETVVVRLEPSKSKKGPVAVGDDRRAAEWVLSLGGRGWIRVQDKEQGIKPGMALPSESFHLRTVWLGRSRVDNSGLAHLAGLASLTALELDSTAVSDSGLVHLANCPNLTTLGLSNTKVKGPGLAHLAGLANLASLGLGGTEVNDDALAHLAKRTSLTSLNLGSTRISNVGIEHLAGLTNLTTLNLTGTGVGNPGLAHLARLTNLTLLELRATQISNSGLKHLAGLTNLTDLGLHATDISDSGLPHLARLTRLVRLDLGGTGGRISPDSLSHIKGLTNLKHLGLAATAVNDSSLAHLVGMTRLEGLDLGGTNVGDAGLVHLANLSHLWSLFLHGTKVSNSGLSWLKGLTNLRQIRLANTRVRGGLEHLAGLTNLTVLDLAGTRMNDGELAHLARLSNLAELNLDDTRVSNAGLGRLRILKDLSTLGLANTRVSDSGLEQLVSLSKLTALNLEGARISRKGFASLKEAFPEAKLRWSEPNRSAAEAVLTLGGQVFLEGKPKDQPSKAADLPSEYFRLTRINLIGVRKPLEGALSAVAALADPEFDRLESLDLSGTTIKGDDLALLEPLTRLTELNLARTAVTDSGLARLKPLTGLKRLTLDGAAINGSGLASLADQPELTELRLGCPAFTDAFAHRLADLKRLEVLSLAKSGITDKGLEKLHGLTKLLQLDLTGAKVSAASVKAARKALPKCRIVGP